MKMLYKCSDTGFLHLWPAIAGIFFSLLGGSFMAAAQSSRPNLITNGAFANNLERWQAEFNGEAQGQLRHEAGAAKVIIEQDGANEHASDISVWQLVPLQAGTRYTLQFDIRSSATPKSFQIKAQRASAPWTSYAQSNQTITRAPNTNQHFSYTWTQPTSDPRARVGIRLGGFNDKDIWLDNIVLTEAQTSGRGSVAVGLYPGSRGDLETYESDLGIDLKHRLIFQPVKALKFSEVKAQLDRGNEVILNIEFFDDFPNLDEVAAGRYDGYLKNFADALKNDGREIWLRPLHEFNGNWYNWNVLYDKSHSPSDFKRAYRHIVDLFRNNGARVKMQLNYNQFNGKKDETPFSEFYPGDAYVDMVMVTCYNRAGTDEFHEEWNSFAENFRDPYQQIVSFTDKPIGVAEMSTTSNLGGDKPTWIREAFRSLAYEFPRVRQITWFLINKQYPGEGKRDWDLNTEADEEAFKEGYKLLKSARP